MNDNILTNRSNILTNRTNPNIKIKSIGFSEFDKVTLAAKGRAYGSKFWASWKGKSFGGWAVTLNNVDKKIKKTRSEIYDEINKELHIEMKGVE